MEVVEQDQDTVTIRMRTREEFTRLYGAISSLITQYDALDQVEIDESLEQLEVLMQQLDVVMDGLPELTE